MKAISIKRKHNGVFIEDISYRAVLDMQFHYFRLRLQYIYIYIYIYTPAFCSLHYIRVTVHSIVYYTVPLTMNGHNRVIFSSLDRHHWIGKKGLGEGKLVRIVLEYLVIYTPLQRINRKAVGWCRLRLIRVIIHLRGSNNFRWWLTERGTNVTGAIMWAAAQITSLNNLVQ